MSGVGVTKPISSGVIFRIKCCQSTLTIIMFIFDDDRRSAAMVPVKYKLDSIIQGTCKIENFACWQINERGYSNPYPCW